MCQLEIRTEADGEVFQSKISVSSGDLLGHFNQRVNDLMWAITEEAIRAIMPEGVNISSWTRKHGVHVGIDRMPNRLRHQVFKDGDIAAEVIYSNGAVRSRIFMGRGAKVE